LERRKSNRKNHEPHVLRVQLADGMGNSRWVTADLREASEFGLGISAMAPLPVGTKIMVRGKLGENQSDATLPAQVQWCAEQAQGGFHAGLELLDADHQSRRKQSNQDTPKSAPQHIDFDCYEVMQLSPNADTETIDRVYRLLAKRWHPDNGNTGNPDLFVQLNQAYDLLRDPVRRAAYDRHYQEAKRAQWNVFDQSTATTGAASEPRKRDGILGLLYAKILQGPEHAAIGILEFEQLLGCPREHLQTALWYLRGKGYIQRTDSGRYAITVDGYEVAEASLQTNSAARPSLKMIKAK
jgi:hypothetical protein